MQNSTLADGLTLVVLPGQNKKMSKIISNLQIENEEENDTSVDPQKQLIMQILNCVSYVGGCFSAYASQQLITPNLDEVSDEWALRILPAGWAFIIWAVIYSLLAIFTVYQALPDKCAPNRNNDAIFNKAGWWVSINFTLNASWCLIFQQNNLTVFIIALFVCIGMLGSAIYVLQVAVENRLSPWGIVGMRCGFSVYSGWLTVATTLNIGFVLKAGGLNEEDISIDEAWWAVATLIAVECVYVLVSYALNNPLYACVLEWALFAIRQEQADYS